MKRFLCLLVAVCVCLAASSAEARIFHGGFLKKLFGRHVSQCSNGSCNVAPQDGGAVPAGPVAEPAPKAAPAAPTKVEVDVEEATADEKPSLPVNKKIPAPFHGNVGDASPMPTPASAPEQVPEVAPQPTQWEVQLVSLVNRFRQRNGLPILRHCPSLLRTSRLQCKWMADRQVMQHGNFPVAENIAMGQPDPEAALRTWINSDPHRANMSGRNWTRVAAAAYKSSSGRVYYTLQLSK